MSKQHTRFFPESPHGLGKKLIILFVLLPTITLLLAGCGAAPVRELQQAKKALSMAEAANAQQLAPEEYKTARQTLVKSEQLIAGHRYAKARDLLPHAVSLAAIAERVALEENLRKEQERLKKNREKLRLLELKKSKKKTPPPVPVVKLKPKPKPKPKPAPKKKPVPVKPVLLKTYQVQKDDNLLTIAARKDVYGDPLLWPLLYAANRDQIKDPSKLYEAQTLTIPRDVPADELEKTRNTARKSPVFIFENN